MKQIKSDGNTTKMMRAQMRGHGLYHPVTDETIGFIIQRQLVTLINQLSAIHFKCIDYPTNFMPLFLDADNQPSTPITIDLIDETPPPADQLQPLLTSTDFDDSITYIGTTKMHNHQQQQRRSVEIIFPVIAELEAERDEHAEKRKLCQRSIASKSRIACPICFDDISIVSGLIVPVSCMAGLT
jgi:hypothetical protein